MIQRNRLSFLPNSSTQFMNICSNNFFLNVFQTRVALGGYGISVSVIQALKIFKTIPPKVRFLFIDSGVNVTEEI